MKTTGQQPLTDNVTVAVAMSTYNGERFVADQIDSVLAQEGCDVHLFVRDDGSRDGTADILRDYAARGLIVLDAGENKGMVPSFFAALAMVPDTFEFIAFCDQDDVWHSDKLSRALSVLAQRDQTIPQLYCSEYIFCDEQLNRTARSHLNRNGVSFPKLMAENVCSGNTMVMNRALMTELLADGPEDVYVHDWWTALVAAGLGELTYDDFPSLEYRRTGGTISPTGSSGIPLLLFRIRTFFGKGQLSCISTQLRRYRDRYESRLKPEDRKLLVRMTDGNRFAKAFTPTRLRQKLPDEVAVRLFYLAGLL